MSFKYCCLFASLATSLVLSICVASAADSERAAQNRCRHSGQLRRDSRRNLHACLIHWCWLMDGTVRDANSWYQKRRPEIVRLFEENQFGRSPGRPADMSFDVFDKGTPALDGKAIRRQVTIYFSKNKSGPKMDLLIYLPAAVRKPVPLLLNLSFTANSSAVDDPGIKPGEVWGRDKKRGPAPKGPNFGRLNVARFLAPGHWRRHRLLRRHRTGL